MKSSLEDSSFNNHPNSGENYFLNELYLKVTNFTLQCAYKSIMNKTFNIRKLVELIVFKNITNII